mmetsp:Transcript_15166/g.16867  ORF Transcript_15166/g.16867 Transcript_15166/m.16867 type:complete len:167 (+) Transcript_15166:187-687(+)
MSKIGRNTSLETTHHVAENTGNYLQDEKRNKTRRKKSVVVATSFPNYYTLRKRISLDGSFITKSPGIVFTWHLEHSAFPRTCSKGQNITNIRGWARYSLDRGTIEPNINVYYPNRTLGPISVYTFEPIVCKVINMTPPNFVKSPIDERPPSRKEFHLNPQTNSKKK